MKRILALIVVATISAFALILPNPAPLHLTWVYPRNATDANVTFNLYSHTNPAIPLSNWVRIAIYPATNWYSNGVPVAPVTNYSGTNWLILTVTNMTTPGAQFYYVTVSNFWGEFWNESTNGNILGLPPLPAQGANLRAVRGW